MELYIEILNLKMYYLINQVFLRQAFKIFILKKKFIADFGVAILFEPPKELNNEE